MRRSPTSRQLFLLKQLRTELPKEVFMKVFYG